MLRRFERYTLRNIHCSQRPFLGLHTHECMEDTAPIALQSVVESPKDRAPIDEFGRVYGTAIRKKLRAHVWLSPAKPTTRDAQLESSGQLLIDGHDYKLILTHMRDRYILSRAFHPRLLGAHNVFVQLESAHADKQ